MLCEKCKKNEASVFYRENINGKERKYSLCPECAAELEKNEDGVVFTLLHKELTEAEKQTVCDEYDDCAGCPIRGICAKDLGSDNLF